MTWNWNLEFVDVAANYADLTGGEYDYILLRLRTRLGEDCVHNTPVLPEFTNDNNAIRWFEIRLYLDSSTRVRLRFRRDDLYLYGYQINDEQWRELGVEGRNPHLVDPNSSFLGFTGSYTDLERVAGFGSAQLSLLPLGRTALINAATSLAESSDRKEIAKALLVMILMFSEAARFVPVQRYLQRTFYDDETVPDWVDDLIHRWGRLCGYVMYYEANPYAEWVPQTITIEGPAPTFNPTQVVARTLDEMFQYIGILQNNPEKIRPAPPN